VLLERGVVLLVHHPPPPRARTPRSGDRARSTLARPGATATARGGPRRGSRSGARPPPRRSARESAPRAAG
jgi:hypothetical protein